MRCGAFDEGQRIHAFNLYFGGLKASAAVFVAVRDEAVQSPATVSAMMAAWLEAQRTAE